MPKIEMSVPHQLGREEAMSRIQGMMTQVKEQYGSQVTDLEEQWTDSGGSFSFKAMGFAVSGDLAVHDDHVSMDGDIPWAAAPFKGTIETTIRERAERLLQP